MAKQKLTSEVENTGYFVDDGFVFASVQIDREQAVVTVSRRNSTAHDLAFVCDKYGDVRMQVGTEQVDLRRLVSFLRQLGFKDG